MGKGGRLLQVGCAKQEFIQNSKLVYLSNISNSTDYHNQINSDLFKT